jgi:hypothetical protein
VRITRQGGHITIRDQAAPFWAVGAFLLLGGIVAMAMPLGLATNAEELALWERIASFAIGLGVTGGALWWLRHCPASRVEVDLTRSRMLLVRVGLSGRQVRELAFSELEKVELEVGKDSDGDPMWRPRLQLRSGEQVMLSELWSHDPRGTEEVVSVVADACRLPYGFPQRSVIRESP